MGRTAPAQLLLAIALILAFAGKAAACAICFSGLIVTPGQKLDAADEVVLATPANGSGQFRIVDIVKGKASKGDILEQPGLAAPVGEAVMSIDGLVVGDGEMQRLGVKPMLLFHDKVSERWTNLGAIDPGLAGWLRQLVQTNHATKMPKKTWPQLTLVSSYLTDAEWRERLLIVVPQLESPDPLASEIAYGELSRAPYEATRVLKPQLDVERIASWINDPTLTARRPAYTLLLGIAGGSGTAAIVEQEIDAAMKKGDTSNLSALLAADLELQGASRVEWLETAFFADRQRTLQEVQAALLALSVHGKADAAVPRQRVITAYRYFINARKPMAGFVAMELADWEAWEATPDYVAVVRSKAVRDPAEQFAIFSYLQRSPLTSAQGAIASSGDPQQ